MLKERAQNTKKALSNITLIVLHDACIMAHVIYCFLLANEEVLNEDDLVDIIDALKEGDFPSNDWHRLGSQLRIRNDDLKIIESDYRNKATQCLEECLIKWLKTGKATYTGLAEALEMMGEDAAADHISSVMEERPEKRSVLRGTLSSTSGYSFKKERQEKRWLLGK